MEYVYDGHGSVAQTLASNNMQSHVYTPFGEMLSRKQIGFGFNAEWYDAATGMQNLRARQYEPGMGRFSQKDVLRGDIFQPLSLNRYAYVLNDPIGYIDPSGQTAISAEEYITITICAGDKRSFLLFEYPDGTHGSLGLFQPNDPAGRWSYGGDRGYVPAGVQGMQDLNSLVSGYDYGLVRSLSATITNEQMNAMNAFARNYEPGFHNNHTDFAISCFRVATGVSLDGYRGMWFWRRGNSKQLQDFIQKNHRNLSDLVYRINDPLRNYYLDKDKTQRFIYEGFMK